MEIGIHASHNNGHELYKVIPEFKYDKVSMVNKSAVPRTTVRSQT